MTNAKLWVRVIGVSTVIGFSAGVAVVGVAACDAAAKMAGIIGLVGAVTMLIGSAK